MFCTGCGYRLEDTDRFCAQCGRMTAVQPDEASPAAAQPSRRLTRPMHDKSIAGVCAGFARYLDMDVVLVRIVWLCFSVFSAGAGVIAYLIAWIVMPKDYGQTPRPAASPAPAPGGSPVGSQVG